MLTIIIEFLERRKKKLLINGYLHAMFALQCESNVLPEDQYCKQSINCDIYAFKLVLYCKCTMLKDYPLLSNFVFLKLLLYADPFGPTNNTFLPCL
jgi:hypothetical protein